MLSRAIHSFIHIQQNVRLFHRLHKLVCSRPAYQKIPHVVPDVSPFEYVSVLQQLYRVM